MSSYTPRNIFIFYFSRSSYAIVVSRGLTGWRMLADVSNRLKIHRPLRRRSTNVSRRLESNTAAVVLSTDGLITRRRYTSYIRTPVFFRISHESSTCENRCFRDFPDGSEKTRRFRGFWKVVKKKKWRRHSRVITYLAYSTSVWTSSGNYYGDAFVSSPEEEVYCFGAPRGSRHLTFVVVRETKNVHGVFTMTASLGRPSFPPSSFWKTVSKKFSKRARASSRLS